MVNTINASAAVSHAQTAQAQQPTVKQLGEAMFVELEAIKATLALFDPALVAAKILKKDPGMSPEEAKQKAQDFVLGLASNNYFPSILSDEVKDLDNTLYTFKLGLQNGQYQPGKGGTDTLLALSYEVKLALDNFKGTIMESGSNKTINIFTAAYNGQMSQFLENVILDNPGEMDGVLFALNSITNQMKSLLGLSSSKSASHKEIDASEIDAAAAKPTPLIDAGAKGSGIDAGAKLAALIDASPMIDAAAIPSSLIDV